MNKAERELTENNFLFDATANGHTPEEALTILQAKTGPLIDQFPDIMKVASPPVYAEYLDGSLLTFRDPEVA